MPLAHNYEYEFDELPLVKREGGWIGALIDGVADITYEWCDAGYMDWGVESFVIDGYKLGESKPITITAESDPVLFKLMSEALEARFGDHIADRLSDELEAA
jgi:hypothetical protein